MILKIKTKIYWLHPHFLNWMGGHKYIYEIARRLSKKYDVTVVADVFSEESKNKFKQVGLDTVSLSGISTNRILYWFFLPIYVIKNVLILKKRISSNDILITSMFPMNVVASILRAKHIQLCYEPFAFFMMTILYQVFPEFKKCLYQYLNFFTLGWTLCQQERPRLF